MTFYYSLPKLPTTGSKSFGGENPFASTGNSGFSTSSTSLWKYPTLTERQLAQLKYNLAHRSHDSFTDRIKHAAGFTLDHALDLASRGNYASAGFFDHLENSLNSGSSFTHALESAAHGAVAGVKGNEKHTFGDVINDSQTPFGKFLQRHGKTEFAVSLGLDVALDPTTYLFGAGLVGKTGKAVKLGRDAIEAEKGLKTTAESIKAAQLTNRVDRMAPALEATAAADNAKVAGHAFAQAEVDQAVRTLSQEGASAAEQVRQMRHVELRFGPTKKASIHVRTPLKFAPKLEKAAKLQEKAAAGVIHAKFRVAAKDMFQNHWRQPILGAMARAAAHGENKIMAEHESFADQLLKDTLKEKGPMHMSEAEMQKALAAGDKVGTVDAKGDLVHGILADNLALQGFHKGSNGLDRAMHFLESYHAITQRLMHYSQAAGVPLEEGAQYAFKRGHMYVPRRVIPDLPKGARFTLPDLAKVQGVQKVQNKTIDFEGILKGIADGSINPDHALSNPMAIIGQIIHESSKAQSAEMFKTAVRKTLGTKGEVFDRALGDNKYAKQIAERKETLHTLQAKLNETGVEHLTAKATQAFLNTAKGNKETRIRIGRENKAIQAEIDASTPMGKDVVRHSPEEVAKVKAKGEGATLMNSKIRGLQSDIREAEKPWKPGVGGKISGPYARALMDQREYIQGLKEDLYHAETPSPHHGTGSGAEYGENATAPKSLTDQWGTLHDNLSAEQEDALGGYLQDSQPFSELLWDTHGQLGPDPYSDSVLADKIREMDSIFRNADGAPEPFTVFHGSQFAHMGEIPEAGKTYEVPKFISSSTDPRVGQIWAGHMDMDHPAFPDGGESIANGYAANNLADAIEYKALYHIRVPKGAKTLGNLSGFEDERGAISNTIDEVILQRGGSLRIRQIGKPDKFGIHHIKADYIPPKTASKSVDPAHLRRQLDRAEATLKDPEALKRKWGNINVMKARLKTLKDQKARLDAVARKRHPTGHVGEVTFKEQLPHKGSTFPGPGEAKYMLQHGNDGFMHLHMDKRKKFMMVDMVRVVEGSQRKGVGRKLYDAAFAIAETKGIRELITGDIQSEDAKAFWEKLRANPPKGWTTDPSTGHIVRDPHENIRVARLHKQLKDNQKILDKLPPAKQVRLEHAQQLLDIANDPKRAKAEANLTKRVARTEKAIAKLKPKAFRAMYKANPEALKADLVHAIGLDQKGVGGMVYTTHLPADVAPHFNKMMEALISPREQNAIEHAARKAMGEWKKLVTVVNPGYTVRNMVSDLWNMYLADVPAWAIVAYSAKASRMMVRGLVHKDPKSVEYLREFELRGAGSGLFAGDVRTLKHHMAGLAKPGRYQRGMDKVLKWNQHRENWGRLIHYMYRTEHEGMSHAMAAREVRKAHFDYTDLTEFEQKVMKNIVPFYTWTRKNVPYQLEKLVTRPGRINLYNKISQEAQNASGGQYSGPLGMAMQGKPMGFQVAGRIIDPRVGLEDLYNVSNPQQVIGMLNPAIKIPLELLQNRSTFTGQPLYGDQATAPTSSSWLSSVFGGDKVIHDYGKGPKAYDSAPWWATYAVNQIPQGSFLNSLGNQAAKDRSGMDAGGLNLTSPKVMSYVFGLSTAGINPAYEKMVSKYQADAKFKVYYKWLQAQGKATPSTPYAPSPNQAMVDRAAYFGR